jgi:hypothetical protein
MCGPGDVVCAGVCVHVRAMQPGPRCVRDHAAALVPRSLYHRYVLLGLLPAQTTCECRLRWRAYVVCAGVRAMHVHVGCVACEQRASRGSTHKTLCLRGQSRVKVKVARFVHMYADSPWSYAFDAISPWVSFVRGDVSEDFSKAAKQ